MNANLLLEHIAKHIVLLDDEREFFVSLLHSRKLKKRQYLSQEGDISKGPVFVTEGILRSYSLDKNGFEHIIQFAPPGWWIVDMHSMVHQKPGTLYIDAIDESEVIWIWKSDLDKLYTQIPKFERLFRILAEHSLITYQHRLISNMSMSARERYDVFCSQYPSLIQCLPQKHVASYIGVTPEFLSKMLSGSKPGT